jgi:KaiC/GvpD/RAD55 family RecA-like ATPase
MKKHKKLKNKQLKINQSKNFGFSPEYVEKRKAHIKASKKVQKRRAEKSKFKFTPDFQFEIIRFILKDQNGMRYSSKLKDYYFTLITHGLIARSLFSYIKKYGESPTKAVLYECIYQKMNSRSFEGLVTNEDKKELGAQLNNLYNEELRNAEFIKEQINKFVAYVKINELNQHTDFSDYDNYNKYVDELQKILQESRDDDLYAPPLSLIDDVVKRQIRRQQEDLIIPTPFKQLNRLTNAGGFTRNSIIVLLDKPKGRKTFTLINTARGYFSSRKNILYVDTENGDNEIMDRMIQSCLHKTKKELITGDHDVLEAKFANKLRKVGSNFFVKRVPALTTVSDVKNIILNFQRERGIKIDILMIDYAGKLSSDNSYSNREDFDRIQRVYVELENMSKDLDLDCIWTAQHTTRPSTKRKETRYSEEDIAGCISIVRNATAVIGINSSEYEERAGYQRLEIVVQRDGIPFGRALLKMDLEYQKMKEPDEEQIRIYETEVAPKDVDQKYEDPEKYHRYFKKRQPAPNYNKEKYEHKTGDLKK